VNQAYGAKINVPASEAFRLIASVKMCIGTNPAVVTDFSAQPALLGWASFKNRIPGAVNDETSHFYGTAVGIGSVFYLFKIKFDFIHQAAPSIQILTISFCIFL